MFWFNLEQMIDVILQIIVVTLHTVFSTIQDQLINQSSSWRSLQLNFFENDEVGFLETFYFLCKMQQLNFTEELRGISTQPALNAATEYKEMQGCHCKFDHIINMISAD